MNKERPSRHVKCNASQRSRVGPIVAAAVPSLVLLALSLACGRVGPPRPPIRLTPQAPSELRVAQRGDKIELTCRAPRASVDGARLTLLDVEFLVTTGTGDPTKATPAHSHRVAPGEVTSETMEPLPQPGTTLRVVARSRISKRLSAPTWVASLEVQPPPAVARNLAVARSASSVQITWKPARNISAGGMRYWVYRRPVDGTYEAPLNTEPSAEFTLDDKAADADAAVCYVVRTVATSTPVVESGDSVERCLAKRPPVPLPAPEGLVAVPSGANVELSWSCAGEPGVVGHRVYRAGETGAAELRAEVKAGQCVYRDEGVPTGVALRYTLTSVGSAGNESAPASFGTLRPRVP
jgi:hypothetical protein